MKNSNVADRAAVNLLIDRLSLRAVTPGAVATANEAIDHLSLRAIGNKPMTNEELALRVM